MDGDKKRQGARCRRKDGEHVARAGTKAALAFGSLCTPPGVYLGHSGSGAAWSQSPVASPGTMSSGGLNVADKSRNGNNAHLYFHPSNKTWRFQGRRTPQGGPLQRAISMPAATADSQMATAARCTAARDDTLIQYLHCLQSARWPLDESRHHRLSLTVGNMTRGFANVLPKHTRWPGLPRNGLARSSRNSSTQHGLKDVMQRAEDPTPLNSDTYTYQSVKSETSTIFDCVVLAYL